MNPSRWLTWTPPKDSVIGKSATDEVPKVPKPSFVSFGTPYPALFSITERQEDQEPTPIEGPPVCAVHGDKATWWVRQDGGQVCDRCHPDPVAAATRDAGPPIIPPGVTLFDWQLKAPPIALSTLSVVTDPLRFAVTTLAQLDAALRGDNWAAGNRTVRDLIERLEQVGVRVRVADAAREQFLKSD